MWNTLNKSSIRLTQRHFRGLRNFFSPPSLCLLYHRVAELPSDSQLLAVSPKNFAGHLEVLASSKVPRSLTQFSADIANCRVPKNSVVITFDDGYADNLHEAKPILERYSCPVTIFVSSAKLGTKSEFWWDELERIFLLPGELPEILTLSINGLEYKKTISPFSKYSAKEYRRHHAWNVLEASCPTPRHALYLELCGLLRNLPTNRRDGILNEIVQWAGLSREGRQSHRSLATGELIKLDEAGLIEIGGHTVNHPMLSKIPREEQKTEIEQNKSTIEEILGHKITAFSYPFGSRSDYDLETAAAVRAAGFTTACANFPGLINGNTDPFQIPRFLVRNWTANEFKHRLAAFNSYV